MMFLNEGFLDHVMNRAKVIKASIGIDFSCTKEALLKYLAYQLGSGIVGVAQERLLFQRNDVHGLLSNGFLKAMLSHEELVQSKKIFIGERAKMTKCFNEASAKYWKPAQ